jgi:hypothetical protein
MGWTYEHRDRGTSHAAYFQAMYSEGWQIIDSATVGGTFYAAVRNPDGKVEAHVSLIRWAPHDLYNFGHKDMTESWGPTEARCPDRILDQLDSTESLYGETRYNVECDEHRVGCEVQYGPQNEGKWRGWDKPHVNQRTVPTGSRAAADDWRAACRAYNARVGQVKRGTLLRHGDNVYEALDLRRNIFRNVAGGYRTRWSWWRSADFTIEGGAA